MPHHPKSLSINDTLLVIIDMQTKLSAVMKYREQMIDNLKTMIEGCNILKVPIVITEQYPNGLGRTEQALIDLLPEENEPIEKLTFSCWDEPNFRQIVQDSKRQKIILTGIETHVCVYQTAMDLIANNYHVYVLRDCVGSRHKYNWKAGLARMREIDVGIYTTEMALFELLKRSDIAEFKPISKLLK